MFTGIIESTGNLHRKSSSTDNLQRWEILTDIDTSDVKLGDSIAVDGVCLTVTDIQDNLISFDLGKETLDITALGSYPLDTKLHLEKALRLSDRLGGHLVQGHVDCVGNVVDIQMEDECTIIHFAVPADNLKYCVKKGSVTINGVSLTVNEVSGLPRAGGDPSPSGLPRAGGDPSPSGLPRAGGDPSLLSVCLIPHTLNQTNLGALKKNDPVNIEVDMIAKYLEQLIMPTAIPA